MAVPIKSNGNMGIIAYNSSPSAVEVSLEFKFSALPPFQKSILIFGACLAGSAALMLILVAVMIYVPENYLLRDFSSRLSDWMPENSELPYGMILVSRSKSSNKDIANNYADPKTALKTLESFGREEGLSYQYEPTSRCSLSIPREININIVLLDNAEGAKGYYAFTVDRDSKEALRFEAAQMGDEGQLFWLDSESRCADGLTEQVAQITFHRDNTMNTVWVMGVKGQMSEKTLLSEANRLAQALDRRLRSKNLVSRPSKH